MLTGWVCDVFASCTYTVGEVGYLYSCFLETVALRKCEGELPKTIKEIFGD